MLIVIVQPASERVDADPDVQQRIRTSKVRPVAGSHRSWSRSPSRANAPGTRLTAHACHGARPLRTESTVCTSLAPSLIGQTRPTPGQGPAPGRGSRKHSRAAKGPAGEPGSTARVKVDHGPPNQHVRPPSKGSRVARQGWRAIPSAGTRKHVGRSRSRLIS